MFSFFQIGITTRPCNEYQYDCKSGGCKDPENVFCVHGSCIPKSWVNDGLEECADGSDEGVVGEHKLPFMKSVDEITVLLK